MKNSIGLKGVKVHKTSWVQKKIPENGINPTYIEYTK